MKKINTCVCSGLHILIISLLVGCHQSNQEDKDEIELTIPTPLVSTIKVEPTPLEIYETLPGRVMAVRTADIRPQVTGIIQQRLFKQGAEVKAGQSLFQIDPAPFVAEADTAKANLLRAQVTFKLADDKVTRLKPLLAADAISRQDYDDAVLLRDQAGADIAVAKATLARRQLDVTFANVTAPISGRIEQALVSEGTLVSSTDTSPMARIQQIDQVFVDIRRPATSFQATREALAANSAGESNASGATIEILHSNGQPYPIKGQALFSGINIDVSTGDVLLRVLVDNPQRLLLPGMFIRAKVLHSSYQNALMVPQQAVMHLSGVPHVWRIDEKNFAHFQPIALGELIQGQYHIQDGIEVGDIIVIEGMDRLQDGMLVNQHPWKEFDAPSAPVTH
ncbi:MULTISPECIES: efflux RND transporter periplasmic adaptor subunit [Marinomonas]|uniref:Membrane fusion protein, multidrug efflux system n=1 Tax=Marinomonas polaris DSM 16579 TaxID=1122206 RepID=A0A1M5LUK2_9GAMM|nr:efflux RND transporter periplasmic adaptor subunit [Marinomonas polaris]SHG68073.1 membrane fusion protein, multidrug efflux system [Marinomonas polaris DSM 16579]